MEKGISFIITTYPTFHKAKRFLSKLLQYFLLVVLFVFLAGHENSNPRLGKSHIDFFLSESKHLLEINAKAWLINPSGDCNSINYKIQELTNEFYNQRNYLPAWTINYARAEHLNNLIRVVDSAEYFGFPKSFFNSNRLITKLDILETNTFGEEKIGERIDLEIEATQTALLYMIYLRKGIIKEDTSSSFLSFVNSLPQVLNNSIENKEIEEGILAMQPNNTIYKKIITEIPRYLNAFYSVSDPSGGISKSVLSDILYFTENLQTRAFDSVKTIEKTIAEFQKAQNVNVDGVLNTSTVEKMAEVLSYKFQLIALNLDRLRKIEINSENYLFVNIPEYRLFVFNRNNVEKIFNVVVGKKKTPTPRISSQLEKIITNPYWTVPRSIVNNEMLSKIRSDSTFLQRNGYFIINGLEEKVDDMIVEWELDDPLGKKYWLRQNNGSGNALGRVKFIFPNNYRVFLHDTPSKRLFAKKKRAFSHGCIRVQNSEELAQYLSDKYFSLGKDSVNIKKSIAKRKREEFNIESKVEIHVQYLTCSVNAENELVFFNDLYKQDKEELESLFLQIETI